MAGWGEAGRIDYILVVIRILYSGSWRLDHFPRIREHYEIMTYSARCCHLSNAHELGLMYAIQPTLASSSSLASVEVHALYRVISLVIISSQSTPYGRLLMPVQTCFA